ncbi:MAG: hypothetical protein KC731_27175, partial [Myxococcales bacterium]|nr:hypothetical protein [Myxococcales bacterium]
KTAKKKAARSRDELIAATREGKSKDRSKALTELAALDPRATESIALEWLQELDNDNWREAAMRTMNAIDLLPEIVQPEGIAILCREALRRGSTGVDDQIFHVLSRCAHPDTATIVASHITHEAIAESVGQTSDLLKVLANRGEVGDEAKIRSLVDDPEGWLALAKPWFLERGAEASYAQWLELLPSKARKVLEAAGLEA